MARDDFPPAIVKRLAERVAHLCSAPTCRAPTVGPSPTRSSGVSQVGVAAHITAASDEGPRFDAKISGEERASYSNGIWLCATHAKMIDDDTDRFTIALLKSWKAKAEAEASKSLGRPKYYDSRRLAPHQITVPAKEKLRDVVSNFMSDVGIRSWGEQCASIMQNLTYELALNHLTHSRRPTPVRIESSDWGIQIVATGRSFSMSHLLNAQNGRGGQAALNAIRKYYQGTLILHYYYHQGKNIWDIRNMLIEGNLGPCSIDIRDVKKGAGQAYPERLADCDEVHIYASYDTSFSDVTDHFDYSIKAAAGKPLIVHGLANEPGLRAYIAEVAPGCTFV